jgi:predicted CoA-substrate-specific enzyme activase
VDVIELGGMGYFLGLDVGSVNVKLALIDGDSKIIKLDAEKVTASPQAAIAALISRLGEKFNLEEIEAAGVSGSGRSVIPKDLNWVYYSSSLAIASGLLQSHHDAKTIIQIGGQTSLVIGLEEGLVKPWKVASNPLCAAGTGRFLEQQAYRVGVSIDDFASMAQRSDETPPRIAARCSVFAKTDLIHLQQKGVPLGTMLCGLCDSIARGVASLVRGTFEEPVYFVGGVAANSAIVASINEVMSARNGYAVSVIVPENFRHIESIGAALLAKDSGRNSQVIVLP